MKRVILVFIMIVGLAFFFILGAKANLVAPVVINVDDDRQHLPGADFTKIQDAVNAASPGNTIFVFPGTYTENIDVSKDHLTILSTSGADVTIVQAANPNDHVFEVTTSSVKISGFTIKGKNKSGIISGIYLNYVSNCEISNNKILDNAWGINVYADRDNIIMDNICENNDRGIFVGYTQSGNTFLRNNCKNNNTGLFLYGGNNAITSNILENNTYGILIYSSMGNNTLTNNIMSGNKYNFSVMGFDLSQYIHAIDASNKVDGKPIYYLVGEHDKQIPSDAGYVAVVDSTNITIKDLTLANNDEGVLLSYSTNSRIENIKVINNYYGVRLHRSSNNIVTGNEIINNYNGILLYYASNGIPSCTDNIVINNRISNNENGVYIADYAKDNTIVNNNVSGNKYGIYLGSFAEANYVYLNNFLNNDNNVNSLNVTSKIIWNSSEEINYKYNNTMHTGYLGNYWKSYIGNDTNLNGVGDTPYSIRISPNLDKDNYPLMMPFENYIATENIPPNRPTNILPLGGSNGVTLAPTLQSSLFSDPDIDDIHFASQWQVTKTSGNYSTPVFDSAVDPNNLTQIALQSLEGNTTYYWHVRYQDNHNAWSEWSVETSFTTESQLQYAPQVSIPPFAPYKAIGINGTIFTFVIKVENKSAMEDTIDITANSESECLTISPKNSVTLPPSGSEILYIKATAKNNENINITASSKGDSSKKSSCEIKINEIQREHPLYFSFYFNNPEGHILKYTGSHIKFGPVSWKNVDFVFEPEMNQKEFNIKISDEITGENVEIPIKINASSVISTGFDIAKDGYSFDNWELFKVKGKEISGNCTGMSATSILYFNYWNHQYPAEKPPQFTGTYLLPEDKAKDRIETHTVFNMPGFFNPWSPLCPSYSVNKYNEYDKLKKSLEMNKPMILIMNGGVPNHAVVAYRIIDTADKAYIMVYDNRIHYISGSSQAFQYIEIDQIDHIGRTIGEIHYSDTLLATNGGLIEKFAVMLPNLIPESGTLFTALVFKCPVNICIKDQNNKIISNDGTNEIPGAYMLIGVDEKLFCLPSNMQYTVQIDAYDNGKFSFTKISSVEGSIILTKTEDISITAETQAFIMIKPNIASYTIEVDYNGDGTIDEVKTPDYSDNLGAEDVTTISRVDQFNTRFDRRTGQFSIDMTIKNNSVSETLNTPIKLIVKNINPFIAVANADVSGTDTNGKPYYEFDYSNLVGTDGLLSPSETSFSKCIIFNNPSRLRFTFDVKVMAIRSGGVPTAPSMAKKENIAFTMTIPGQSTLLQSYPNPFNPEVWIPYELAESANVAISIYDTSGRLVRTLDLGHKEIDVYATREEAAYWDGRNEIGEQVSSGIYFYQIKAGDFVATRKFVMLK